MNQIGPSPPPGFKTDVATADEEGTSEEVIGPKLPPHSTKNQADVSGIGESSCPDYPVPNTYGPTLPPGFLPHETSSREEEELEEDAVIGPMPSTGEVTEEEELARRRKEVEVRSQSMKDRLSGKGEEAGPKREEWMTELPVEFKPLGIGARKFRTKVVDCGDRSVWTDTPMDRLKKSEEGSGVKKKEEKKEKKAAPLASVVARDKAMAEQVERYNKEHRPESLMDMHKRKRKAEELEKKGTPQERRPFDRERDLEAPRSLVTPAKRTALMKGSKHSLDSQFHRGSQSFL